MRYRFLRPSSVWGPYLKTSYYIYKGQITNRLEDGYKTSTPNTNVETPAMRFRSRLPLSDWYEDGMELGLGDMW